MAELVLAKARCFLLRGEIQDVVVYHGEAPLDGATALIEQVARTELLPEACVLDIDLIADRSWRRLRELRRQQLEAWRLS
jgi:hypothetical protein